MLFNDVRGGAGSGQSYLWDIKAKTDLIIETMYIEFTTQGKKTCCSMMFVEALVVVNLISG